MVTRGAVVSERVPGGFAARLQGARPRSRSPAAAGAATSSRGSAPPSSARAGAVDRLRTLHRDDARPTPRSPTRSTLAATDPANPYGAALPWPDARATAGGHRPGRKAGALVVLVDGELALYVERGGTTLLTWHRRRRRCSPPALEALAERRTPRGAGPADRREGRRRAASSAAAPTPAARGARGRRLRRHPARAAGCVPEGDTVWRAARHLDRALTGQVLTATDFRVPALRHRRPRRRHRHGDASSRGKHLLTRIDATAHDPAHPPEDGGRLAPLHARAALAPPGARGPGRAAHGDDWTAVGFALGVVELVRPRRTRTTVVGHLGPDLLGPDWDAAEALRRLLADPARADRRGAARPAQPGRHRQHLQDRALLPRRRRTRARPVGDVADLAAMVDRAHRLLDANKRPRRADHHRRPPPRPAALGLPARPAALPPLRHPDPRRPAGPRGPGAGDLLVSRLPALTMTP